MRGRGKTVSVFFAIFYLLHKVPDCTRCRYLRMPHLKPGLKHNKKFIFSQLILLIFLWLFLLVRNMSTWRNWFTKMFCQATARTISYREAEAAMEQMVLLINITT